MMKLSQKSCNIQHVIIYKSNTCILCYSLDSLLPASFSFLRLPDNFLKKLFLSEGGTLLDQHKVTEILPGPVVTVVTNKATFRTRKLVVTAGAWTAALVRKLGVELPYKVKRL